MSNRTDSERLASIEAHLEHMRPLIESWPRLCAEHRASCAEARDLAHSSCAQSTCARLVRVEEQAAAVGRARLISSWVWGTVATASGIGLGGLGAYELVRKLWP